MPYKTRKELDSVINAYLDVCETNDPDLIQCADQQVRYARSNQISLRQCAENLRSSLDRS